MDFSKKPLTVIYIDKNKALFYFENTKITLQLDFPPNVISDLDLLSKERLEELIDTFINSNNLKDSKFEAVLVFSPVSAFEKDFLDDIPKDKEVEIKKFIDLVPFEEVQSKEYKLGKKTKVVAINKTLYDSIINIFKKRNIFVSSVLPFSVLQEISTELTHSVNLSFIAAKSDSYKQYSFIINNEDNSGNDKQKIGFIQKKNIRIYVLAGVFLILLLVLIVLVITTLLPANNPQKNQIVLPTFTPTPTVEEIIPTVSPSESIEASISATITPTITVISEPSL